MIKSKDPKFLAYERSHEKEFRPNKNAGNKRKIKPRAA